MLAFRHVPFEDPGLIAPALARAGIGCRISDLFEDPGATVEWESAAGLIFMGGPMSANDELPFLDHEMSLIRQAAARGIPLLGICLGAQLIARALGGRVYRNPVKEIGWAPVRWTGAAAVDPLFHGLGQSEMVFHWHGETFDPPPGAVLLAFSDHCKNQAFRLGSDIYALQFHIETTPEMIADWRSQPDNADDLPELQDSCDAPANFRKMSEVAYLVFGRWAELLKKTA